MATTPHRTSGLPRSASGIPTPGRARSTSNAAGRGAGPSSASAHDDEYMSRAFADAIRANDPAQHRTGPRISDVSSVSSLAPSIASSASYRPSSVSSVSSSGSAPPRPKTPATAGPRPPSRAGEVFTARSASRAGRSFDVGDNVRIESLGFEGTLRYLGEIDGKQGLWAGVELSAGFAGKGKNDGSVAGCVCLFIVSLLSEIGASLTFYLKQAVFCVFAELWCFCGQHQTFGAYGRGRRNFTPCIGRVQLQY
jgi:CAP-Gly domain-containing linker protein 1